MNNFYPQQTKVIAKRTTSLFSFALKGIGIFLLFMGWSGEITAQLALEKETYTSSGSFPVPDGVTTITVEAWGAGGGGGGSTQNNRGGSGGGGGAYALGPLTVTPGPGIVVTVGEGGAGGNNGDGALGGSSSVGTIVAGGGSGGGR